MRKFILYILLFGYIFSTTELHQLLKMPVLLEHYKEHKQKNQSLTIIGFLELHYLKGNLKDSDYEKDMQLPFKNFQDNHPNIVLALPKEAPLFEPLIKFKEEFRPNFKYLVHAVTSPQYAIWQPPKLT